VADATSIDTADVLAIDAAVARTTGADGFGITRDGFVPKPFARLLAEKLALARALFGNELDLGSGSAVRKLLEVSALEDWRTWSALSGIYDNSFVPSARGDALSRLGEEVGIERPHLEAQGKAKLKLTGAANLPAGTDSITLPRGSRMTSADGAYHAATAEAVTLSASTTEQEVQVTAFYPGQNISSTNAAQKLTKWNADDPTLQPFFDAQKAAQAPFDVQITHTVSLTGGELLWPDERYRALLLRAPRSIWTADSIELAVSLVPGVRRVQVRDMWGGLDVNQSIFGNFNFIQRVFGAERDIGTPYYLTILVAPTPSAIWSGPTGLRAAVESAIEDLRPISIFPQIQEAEEIGIGVAAELSVRDVPLPSGDPQTLNNRPEAKNLKSILTQRLRSYVEGLSFGEPVRASEVVWALMNEHGIADARDVELLRYPPGFDAVDFGESQAKPPPERLGCGDNVELQANQVPRLVDDPDSLWIV
jgi:hypothetical protein